jgi:hypothetical protein
MEVVGSPRVNRLCTSCTACQAQNVQKVGFLSDEAQASERYAKAINVTNVVKEA